MSLLDYDHNLDVVLRSSQQQLQPLAQSASAGTYVVLYDYTAQRSDEIQLNAGRLVGLLDSSERDWWKVRALDGINQVGYFPSTYLTKLYQNERPLQVAHTIQVSDGETCDKLIRGQVQYHLRASISAVAVAIAAALTAVNISYVSWRLPVRAMSLSSYY